jgi:hypothetical protein
MKLAEELARRGVTAQDSEEVYFGLQPVANAHAPSLRNPIKSKTPDPRDGWKPGASKKAREKAMKDMAEIQKRTRKQTGRTAVTQTTAVPVFPGMAW